MTKVYHISRFRERYELSDDNRLDRKSPLIYTKDFVRGVDDESCAHGRQLMALRSKRNWLLLRGAFSELKNVGGNMSSDYRGYLLDSNFEPASVKEIGRWLGVSEKKAQKIIDELLDVGLLEYVAIPKFNGQPRRRTGKPGRARRRTGKSGKARAPLKKKTKTKTKAKTNVKTKTKVKTNGKGKTKRKIKKRQSKDKPQKAPPSTTQPLKPQIPQGRGLAVHSAPPSKLKNTELVGDVTKNMLHRYNPHAKRFALETYQALKLPWDPASEEGKRELGCFASMWHKIDLPEPVFEELRARAIAEAKKISKRRQNKKKGAVWCVVFKNLYAAYSQRRKVK